MEQQQPPSWSNLPDVCLLLVFKNLPANDMAFSVGQVCANWARVQRDVLRREHLWSYLPRVYLLALFKYISLDDMIRHVGRVCTNWGKVQRVELRRRHVLVIADKGMKLSDYDNPYGSELIEKVLRDDGSPWATVRSLDQIEHDTLRFPARDLNETFTTPLMAILPNITHLTIKIFINFSANRLTASVLEQVTRIINHYAPKLISLRLGCIRMCSHPAANRGVTCNVLMAPLFNAINRLESLRHLTLNIETLGTYPKLSILSRLCHISSDQIRSRFSLFESLRQYATGDDLRVEFGAWAPLDELNELDPHLATKFIRVHVNVESRFEDMHKFCSRFVSLHSLDIGHCAMPMTMLARALSLLPQLVHLKLTFSSIPSDEHTESPPEIAQLSSVRLLTMFLCPESHQHTKRLHLHQIFPNLQVLHLTQYTCGECDELIKPYRNEEDQPEVIVKRVHCMHLARQPFRQCANLHTVKLIFCQELQRLNPPELITRDQLGNL